MNYILYGLMLWVFEHKRTLILMALIIVLIGCFAWYKSVVQ
jgi:hypothetical protein